MSTRATDELRELARQWKLLFKSAEISGIVGDTTHRRRGGYHISRMDQTDKANYSVVRPDDKLGPDDTASAVDMNLNPADMVVCTKRLVAAYDNVNDPRRKYLNAFNGTLDGKVAQRWDVYAKTVSWASADHLWHVHLSIRRRYSASPTAVKAILSMLRGEAVAAYMASIGITTASRQTTSLPASAKGPVTPPPVAPVTAPPFPGRVLRRNDSASQPDTAVKAFQVQMLKRGWSSLGVADGFFGPKMERLVRRWQSNCGLPADGVIGPKTWPTPWTRRLGG